MIQGARITCTAHYQNSLCKYQKIQRGDKTQPTVYQCRAGVQDGSNLRQTLRLCGLGHLLNAVPRLGETKFAVCCVSTRGIVTSLNSSGAPLGNAQSLSLIVLVLAYSSVLTGDPSNSREWVVTSITNRRRGH